MFDLSIVILPFEKELFEKEGANVKFFGHPAAAFINSMSSELSTVEKEDNQYGNENL